MEHHRGRQAVAQAGPCVGVVGARRRRRRRRGAAEGTGQVWLAVVGAGLAARAMRVGTCQGGMLRGLRGEGVRGMRLTD